MNADKVQRLVNHLVINSSFIDGLGLYYGKMGIAFFLYHYRLYTNEPMYALLADRLIEDIYENIHENISVTMSRGLCGIAWGLCSLLEEDFLDGDPDEILNNLDSKIMERDPSRITDLSFDTGLEGIWCYVQMRITYAKKNQRVLPFDERYREAIRKRVQNVGLLLNASSPLDMISTPQYNSEINFSELSLGLDNGCAGVALKYIT